MVGLFNWGNTPTANVRYDNTLAYVDPSTLPSAGGFTTSPNVWKGFNSDTNTLTVNTPTNYVNGKAPTDSSGGGLFGLNAGTLGAIGAGLQGLSGLASAYTGFKALQQAQDQFDFQKKLANRNIANQAKVINNTYDNAAQVAAGMIGGRDSSGNFGMTDQAIIDRYARKAKDKHVDGSSIG